MESLTLINGNDQKYQINLPTIVILAKYINDVALAHIKENTELNFKECMGGYEAVPVNSQQIVKLFLTYNYKTQYHNNATNENILFLKGDHHVGFKVDSICFSCVKRNRINTHGLKEGDFLSC